MEFIDIVILKINCKLFILYLFLFILYLFILNFLYFSFNLKKYVNDMLMERPSWKEYFSKICLCTKERSPCERLKVGCLLVKENRIISQGYNGFLPGCPHNSIVRDGHEQGTVHAEQNAIADCAKRGVSCLGAEAYITHYPCIICCRILLASGIKEINYLEDYKNDELVKVFCDSLGVKLIKIGKI